HLLLAVGLADRLHVPRQIRAPVDQRLDPEERLLRRLVLVGAVQDQTLAEQEQSAEFDRLDDRALTRLPLAHGAGLKRAPEPELVDGENVAGRLRLPRVEDQ